MSDVAKALRKLPSTVRKMLELSCDGDWDRVTLQPDGSFKVHNRAPVSRPVRAHLGLSWQAPGAQPEPVVIAPPRCCGRCSGPHYVEDCPEPLNPPKQRMTTVSLEELQQALGAPAPQGGTAVLTQPKGERPAPAHVWVAPADDAPEFDWDAVDLQQAAVRFQAMYANGLPAGVGFSYLPDVLALYGLDEEMTEAVLRYPQRVVVRPESFNREKRYPVLGFHRGDATVILGLKEPVRPCVIAVYMTAMLENDTHRVEHHGGGAGGKAEGGMPKNPGQLKTKLRAWGCTLAEAADHKTVAVTYKGRDLGKVNVDRMMTRQQCEHEWQRMQRRIGGVDKTG